MSSICSVSALERMEHRNTEKINKIYIIKQKTLLSKLPWKYSPICTLLYIYIPYIIFAFAFFLSNILIIMFFKKKFCFQRHLTKYSLCVFSLSIFYHNSKLYHLNKVQLNKVFITYQIIMCILLDGGRR